MPFPQISRRRGAGGIALESNVLCQPSMAKQGIQAAKHFFSPSYNFLLPAVAYGQEKPISPPPRQAMPSPAPAPCQLQPLASQPGHRREPSISGMGGFQLSNGCNYISQEHVNQTGLISIILY